MATSLQEDGMAADKEAKTPSTAITRPSSTGGGVDSPAPWKISEFPPATMPSRLRVLQQPKLMPSS
ncbi:uncharacterized protein LY79DRAFT_670204 [Colletotrichum navitas]|uniref:Uncharacterized protein n=1 Tax=Colletotrichum navitas TaxID=681940 RepID=A0AAD8V2P2_9PEZI|nr:uncharacterized protein LY79DRAFT_670204 [Colletotrichum navitas]KAK1590040.1 hypothetical protein LY79DRAFT_670204 [Colletotrichum navitas]